MNRRKRVHDWRLLKWPFTVTFVYYALLSLFTGMAEGGTDGFFTSLMVAVLIDTAAYGFYCYLLSRDRDDIHKLWFVFLMLYALVTLPQLRALWEIMEARAVK